MVLNMPLRASEDGKEKIKQKKKNYNDAYWLNAAAKLITPDWPQDLLNQEIYPQGISLGTWKRYQAGKQPINDEAFQVYCEILGLDWQDIFDYGWIGRNDVVTKLISQLQNQHRLILLTGITGIGKSALAEKLALELQEQYSELQKYCLEDSQQEPNFSSIVTQIIAAVKGIHLPKEINNPENLVQWLVNYICTHECLLIIDSLECTLVGDEKTGWSNFKDVWWEKFFLALCAAESCQGRIILTSQEMPIQLEDILINNNNIFYHEYLRGFTTSEILKFFIKAGLKFENNTEISSYLNRIGAAYEGHPLALKTIAGEILSFPYHGNIATYWQDYRTEIEEIEQAYIDLNLESVNDKFKLDCYSKKLRAIVKYKIERTFRRLAQDVPNAYKLLCYSSVYRRPVPERYWLKYLVKSGFTREQQEIALDALTDRFLVETDNSYLRQHNLIRSTALEHLRNII